MAVCEFSYTLTQDEVYNGLRLSGVYHTSGKRAIIESALMGVFAVLFFASYFWKPDAFSLVMGFVSLAVLAAVNLVPRFDMMRQAKKGQIDVKIRLYQDKMYVETPEGSQNILLDGSSAIKAVGKQEKILVVNIAGGGLLLIPVRAIPVNIRGEALNLILQENQ